MLAQSTAEITLLT